MAKKPASKPLKHGGLETMRQGKSNGSGGDARKAGNLDEVMAQGNSKKGGATMTNNLNKIMGQ